MFFTFLLRVLRTVLAQTKDVAKIALINGVMEIWGTEMLDKVY